jgi:hypothetical protein
VIKVSKRRNDEEYLDNSRYLDVFLKLSKTGATILKGTAFKKYYLAFVDVDSDKADAMREFKKHFRGKNMFVTVDDYDKTKEREMDGNTQPTQSPKNGPNRGNSQQKPKPKANRQKPVNKEQQRNANKVGGKKNGQKQPAKKQKKQTTQKANQQQQLQQDSPNLLLQQPQLQAVNLLQHQPQMNLQNQGMNYSYQPQQPIPIPAPYWQNQRQATQLPLQQWVGPGYYLSH